MSKACVVPLILLSLMFQTPRICASGDILYGVWSQRWPSGSVSLAEGYGVLADTFKFNVIIGIAPPERIASLQQFQLKAIGQNINESIDPFPEMYAHMSTYVTFYAEGQPYSGTICRDQGSGTVCINSTWLSPHYRRLKYEAAGSYNPSDSSMVFRGNTDSPGRVQKGPYVKQFARYWAGSWRDQGEGEEKGLANYTSTWRFKVGSQPYLDNDTVATLLVLYGEADEADTLQISYVLARRLDLGRLLASSRRTPKILHLAGPESRLLRSNSGFNLTVGRMAGISPNHRGSD